MKTFRILLALSMLVMALVPSMAFAQDGEMEIFSWWAGDEGPALEALIAYNQLTVQDVNLHFGQDSIQRIGPPQNNRHSLRRLVRSRNGS